MGLLGQMRLETADGPIQIKDLVDRTVSTPDYSTLVIVWTGSRLYVDEAYDFRSKGPEQVFDVELDDGRVLKVSASSLIVMKSGDRKMAPELVPGDSLLPLYIERDAHDYPTFRIPGEAARRKIARLMAEWKLGRPLPKGTTVKHVDGNRGNYHPDNLEIILNENRAVKSHKNAVVKGLKLANKLFAECAAASPKMAKIVKRRRWSNHKIVRVTPGTLVEVYTASVRSEVSLSVSGVFLDLASC